MDASFREHFNTKMFNGVEFDATMLRIAAMNLQLHGIEHPNLISKDALSNSNADMSDKFTLVLANPPFKGSLDYDSVESSILKKVKTKKTELLFLGLILRALKPGGRCAVIVPDGVMFGSSNAHKQIRQELVEKQRLQAVISMPSGVFKPYAGVSTAILLFTKTDSGGTDKVWFYDMQADGYSLDDKRNEIKDNDIPDIIARYSNLENETLRTRTGKSFLVPFSEIKTNDWDLSINRYKETVHEEVEYDSPAVILKDIKQLDAERAEALKKLEELLK
jgi:type I restriction enzyme M protein